MLDRAFNPDNPFWSFLNKVIDIAVLELIWILTSIPIVTIGASSSAFWNCVMRICEDDEGHIYSAYFKTFAKTFKNSTLLWLVQLLAAALLVVDIWFCFSIKSGYASFLVGAFAILAVLFLLVSVYIYPLEGRFRFPFKKVLTNALFLGMKHIFSTVAILVLLLAALVLCYFFGDQFYVLLIAPMAAFYLSGKLLLKVFSQYTDEDEEADDPDGLSDILDRLDAVSRDDEGNLVTTEDPESSDTDN